MNQKRPSVYRADLYNALLYKNVSCQIALPERFSRVIVECPSCHARFSVPDAALGTDGRTVRCSKCKHAWHQSPELAAEVSEETTPASDTGFTQVSKASLATRTLEDELNSIIVPRSSTPVEPDPVAAPKAPPPSLSKPHVTYEVPEFSSPEFSSEASQAMDALDRPEENPQPPTRPSVLPRIVDEADEDDDADASEEPKDFIDALHDAQQDEEPAIAADAKAPKKPLIVADAPRRGAPLALKLAASGALAASLVLGIVLARAPIAHTAPWSVSILSMLGAAPSEGLMFSDVAFHREPTERGARISIGCAVRNMSKEPRELPNMRLQLSNKAGEILIEEDKLLAPIATIAPGDVAPCDIPAMNLRSGSADRIVLDTGSNADLLLRDAP